MKKNFYLIIFILIALFGFYLFPKKQIDQMPVSSGLARDSSISMLVSDQDIHLSFFPGETLYQIMSQAEKEHKINFETKEYPGLGLFVTRINDLRHGEDGNLLYYVNGEEASLGISNFKPENADSIEWRLE